MNMLNKLYTINVFTKEATFSDIAWWLVMGLYNDLHRQQIRTDMT